MKKKITLFFLLLFILLPFSAKTAGAYHYENIDISIKINKDSTFDVEEKQTYFLDGSFGFFYRDIELKDLDHITDIQAFDNKGNKIENLTVSSQGNKIHVQWDFERKNFRKELKSWTIKYKVYGGLGFYKDHDEIYWNAIFQDREVEVKKANARVHLPEEINGFKAKLFIGKSGSEKQFQTFKVFDNSVEFLGSNIKPGEFMTIVISWPKGFIQKPAIYKNQLINLLALAVGLIIPLATLAVSFALWNKKGKDAKINKTVIAQYHSDLSPAITGVVVKQNIEIREVLATVTDLAVRGYIIIREEEKGFSIFQHKEYFFERTDKTEEDLLTFEKEILDSLFRQRAMIGSEDIKNQFYKKIPKIRKRMYEEASDTNFFNGNVQSIRKKYVLFYLKVFFLVAVFLALGCLVAALLQANLLPIILIGTASLFISIIIALIFSYYMPALTPAGAEAKWKALGFKEYLHTAERFRIGEENVNTFSKFLPYAIVFGVENQWAKRFEYFSYQETDWFYPAHFAVGQTGGLASFKDFSQSISSFTKSVSSALSPSSHSGSGASGGSAGGGGGGGGGGAG